MSFTITILQKFVFIKTGRMKSLLDPEEDPPQPTASASAAQSATGQSPQQQPLQPAKPKLPRLQTLLDASNSTVAPEKPSNSFEETAAAELENFVESAFTRDQMLAELEQVHAVCSG